MVGELDSQCHLVGLGLAALQQILHTNVVVLLPLVDEDVEIITRSQTLAIDDETSLNVSKTLKRNSVISLRDLCLTIRGTYSRVKQNEQ